MNKKIAIAFIIIGIIITIIFSVYYQSQFRNQSNWICVKVNLKDIKNTTPIAQGGSDTNGYEYYGVYIATINNTTYTLKSYPVSDSKYIDKHATFYINPLNYTNYHEAYSVFSKFRGLAFLSISFVGILYVLLNKSK